MAVNLQPAAVSILPAYNTGCCSRRDFPFAHVSVAEEPRRPGRGFGVEIGARRVPEGQRTSGQ